MSGSVDFRTDPDHARPELRGRTYAVPFDAVWQAALAAIAGQRRWELTGSDDQAGWIEVHAEGWPFRSPAELRIEISLDTNGQTRVDLESTPSDGKPRVGPARRRVMRFFGALDAAVDPDGRHTLDARTLDGGEEA